VHRKTKQGEDLGRRTVIATDQQCLDSGTEYSCPCSVKKLFTHMTVKALKTIEQ